MSKRRRKRKQRQGRRSASSSSGPSAGSTPSGPAASTAPSDTASGQTSTSTQEAPAAREPIVPWRDRVRGILDSVRGYAHREHAEAIEAVIRAQLGDPATANPADVARLVDALICTSGSAGDGRSIAAVHAADTEALEKVDRDQLRRWERERGRGVFIAQRCFQERIEAFDPLEGAGLTLHLLERLGAGRAAEVQPGTVVTATYVPYVARVVAIGLVEFFADPKAMDLFRSQVQASGAAWHEPPPPPPVAGR